MSFESEVRALLAAEATVTALVPAASITSVTAKQNAALPLVVLNRIYTRPSNSLDTGAAGVGRLDNIALDVTCLAKDLSSALAIAEAIRAKLEAARTPTRFLFQDQENDYVDFLEAYEIVLLFSCWRAS